MTKLFEGGFSNDEAKALATLKLFISYEEDCLGGYEKASYDKVKALMAGVQSLIKSGHNGDLSPARMSTTQTRTKFVRGQGAVKVAAIAEVNFGVACAVGYSLCLFLMCFD